MPNLPKRQVRKKVNDLLAAGASYAQIVRALAAGNVELNEKDRVTIDSVRNHCARHFPVQQVARVTYREILERRARENHVDFVEGVGTALTPIAFFETVMVRSYETLVDSDTKVDVHTGIVAAGRLQSLIGSRDYSREIAEYEVPGGQDRRGGAFVVPQSMWARSSRSWRRWSSTQSRSMSSADSFDDDDDAYDPTEFVEADDEF